jgi:CubicO group peptidase (beta-lactamase class C family)
VKLDASTAAAALVKGVRERPWGLAVAAISNGDVQVRIEAGADPLDEETLFQIGSVTKTMTGLLLADAVLRGETTLEATLGDLLGADAGRCKEISLLDLATQRSGLPRLPPNLDLGSVDAADPYADYTEADLLQALGLVEDLAPGRFEYSNMGFMVLGLALSRLAGRPFASLIRDRLFTQLELHGARCGAPSADDDAAPGYRGASKVPWWRTNLPGPGGVAMSIADLASYVLAHLHPDTCPLGEAMELAMAEHAPAPSPMGLGWAHQGGGVLHDGGTGGFRSFVGLHRPTRSAVVLLANSGDADIVTSVGFAVLTEML